MSERSEEGVPPTPPVLSTLHQAREMLPRLVKAASEGRPTPLTRKSEGREYQALLASPQAAEEAGWDLATAASWPTAQARGKLGELIQSAATGSPQVLRRHSTPAAVLIPDPHAPADTSATGPAPATAPRRLAPVSDALTTLPTPTPTTKNPDTGCRPAIPGMSTGIATLDQALGGLQPGRFYLVAGAPGAGASLMATTAARATALTSNLPVLYAASGLTSSDVAARVIAAHTPVDYRRLRAGNLTAGEREAVADTTQLLASAPLFIDDGADLDATAIVSTAPDLDGLALLVIDRLQTLHDPHLPLSGLTAITDAVQTLAHLARTRHLPVLAALDTDNPHTLAALDTDITLTLTRTSEQAHLAIAERDFGTLITLPLRADLPRARITDTSTSPGPSAQAVAGVRPDAPARSPAQGPPPARQQPVESPAAREARAGHTRQQARRRLGSADQVRADLRETLAAAVEQELAKAGGDADAATAALVKRAIPDVMTLFARTRAGARYEYTAYPALPDILRKPSKTDPDLVWEARPSWRHPSFRRHPDGVLAVTALDVNAAYLSAWKVWLPIGKLEHRTDAEHDKKRSGIYLTTPPPWTHTHLPSPLGDREEEGPLWITDATLRLLLRLSGPKHRLIDPPRIHESWTSSATETFLDSLRQLLAAARADALKQGDDVTAAYVKAMYSKFVSTLGESSHNRELVRPEWMHLIRSQAFSNLWGRAYKAHQAGLTVISALGTDELHVAGDWRRVWEEGRGLAEMKVKTDRDGAAVHYTAAPAGSAAATGH